MGFFTCNFCGESVKKNSVDKHTFKCSISEGLSCMDCNKLFWKNTYSSHDSCVTEDQKYGGRDYVSKPFAGKVKQEHFIQRLNDYTNTATNVPPNIQRILSHLATLPNVPKKEKAFMNFLHQNMTRKDKATRHQAGKVWAVVKNITSAQPPQKKANRATKTDGSSKAFQNGSPVRPPPRDTPTKEGKKKKNKNEGEEKEKKNKNGKHHSKKLDQENEENNSKNGKKNRENPSKKRKQKEAEEEEEEEEEKQSVKKRKQEKEAEKQSLKKRKQEEEGIEEIKQSLNSIKKKKNKKSKTSKQQQQPQNDVQTPSLNHQNGISTIDTNWMGDQPNFKWKVAIRRALKTADGKIKLKKLEKIVEGEFLQSLPGGDETKKLEAKKLFATKLQNDKFLVEEKYVRLKE